MTGGRRPGWRLPLLLGTATLAVTIAIAAGARQTASRPLDPIEAAIQAGWQTSPAHARLWIEQDRTQRDCTLHGNRPPDSEAVAIMEREWGLIVYPADGEVFGDWRRGEALARALPANSEDQSEPAVAAGGQTGRGYGQRRATGGQCITCHQLDDRDATSVRSGTSLIGPSLLGYGRRRGHGDIQRKLLYEQIYNSNAVIACSVMPRFGPHKVLTPDQIRDIVAYLLSPQSPVNAGGPQR
jgi:L-cysteine S-thiosulfotransferase